MFVGLLAVSIGCKGNCKTKAEQEQTSYIDSLRAAKESRYKEQLVGKELPLIDSILPESAKGEVNRLVLVCSGFDCGSCIETSFRILNEVALESRNIKCHVIGLTEKLNFDANLLYEDKAIHFDQGGTLHDKLQYMPTPILLYMNGNKIVNLLWPQDYESQRASENTTIIIEHYLKRAASQDTAAIPQAARSVFAFATANRCSKGDYTQPRKAVLWSSIIRSES